jgi:signal transduction histidine kinase
VLHVGIGDWLLTPISQLAAPFALLLVIVGILGAAVALFFTYVACRPIRELASVATDLADGDTDRRVDSRSHDEIGRLASAINSLVDRTRRYRHRVERDETTRRMLIRKIVTAHEDERTTISRELHDEFGQKLNALSLGLHSLPGSCQSPHLLNMVTDLVDHTHRLAAGMRPGVLDSFGLEAALRQYVEGVDRYADVNLDFHASRYPGGKRLAIETEVNLYRIAQEAVTNVIRHSGAAHASVILSHAPQKLTLLVEDDGCGFLAENPEISNAHLGLKGIEERVAMLDGEMILETSPGRGTIIRITVRIDGGEKVGDTSPAGGRPRRVSQRNEGPD